MAPSTREQCEQSYLDLINLRRKQAYYQQQMEDSQIPGGVMGIRKTARGRR